MPRKKKEAPSDGEIYQAAGNKEVAEVILEKLATVVDIPDEPSGTAPAGGSRPTPSRG